jgi:nucleoid-associated protein YgaU
LSAQFPALAPLLNLARAAGNAAFDVALRLNGCTSNVFTPAGSASDARVMRSVLPTWVLNRIQNLQTNPAAVTATPSPSVSTYTVVPGDTLTRIARRLLGSATRVRDLIAANPSLAAHPNLIHPGQILVIPG